MILIPKYNNMVELGGTLAIAHYRDGELIDTRFQSNLVTTAGKKWIAARMKETGRPVEMAFMALGGYTTAGALAITTPTAAAEALTTSVIPGSSPAANYTQLGNRQALSTAGGTVSGATVTYNATFPTTNIQNAAIVEAGIFTTSSGTYNSADNTNVMLCITSFQVVNKGANDTIAITWTVTIQ